MTQARTKLASFEAYLAYSDAMPRGGRYEFIDGELVELPPKSEENNWLALNLRDCLVPTVPPRLVRVHTCELQVPVLQPKDAANRFPDLVVLRPEHLALTQRRLTITLEMPPPRLIAEIVSPGKTNRDRDYRHKRSQYAAVGIPEYWLVDPGAQQVVVLTLDNGIYEEFGVFSPGSTLISAEFPDLRLRADRLLDVDG